MDNQSAADRERLRAKRPASFPYGGIVGVVAPGDLGRDRVAIARRLGEERGELARLVRSASTPDAVADAILAAGYRKVRA